MEKILSIIIPTYNAEKFLDKGLPSFIMDEQQLMDKLEVIIVNDGTPDNSVAVAQKYVDMYPDTFFIVNKENGGHGSAINEGVKHVTGKYFKVIDADDWVDTTALSNIIPILEEEEFDAGIQSYRTFDINTEEYEHFPVQCDGTNKLYTLSELMERWYDVAACMTFHGLLYNTAFYKNQNYELIEHYYYEDQEYAAVPLCKAKTIRLFTEELYVYRIGDVSQSISITSSLKRLPHYRAVILRMIEAEAQVDKMAPGGVEYWMKKVSKFVADTYQLTLVRHTNKKEYRGFCKDLTKEIKKRSPRMYQGIKNKYRVFVLLNRLHMSEETYQTKFMKLLDFARKVFHVDKLHA